MPDGHFGPQLFAFLEELARNNDRDWFEANRERYERDVREPALQLIRDFRPRLQEISPYFEADDGKVGGSMFRIHRDVRFSKDKSPYKTHVGIQFRHVQGKDVHCPGFYLHLEPGESFVGVGIWRPDTETQYEIRDAIVADPDGWKEVVEEPSFRQRFELTGDSLKRGPRGFDLDHPLIEDLKRKDFIAVSELADDAVVAPGFDGELAELYGTGSPFVGYLCRALELPF